MAPKQSSILQDLPNDTLRRSTRQALRKLAEVFPKHVAVVRNGDLTVHSLRMFVEEIALQRHLETTAELHNTDPDLEIIRLQVESQLASEFETGSVNPGGNGGISSKRQREDGEWAEEESKLGDTGVKRRKAANPGPVEREKAGKKAGRGKKRKRSSVNEATKSDDTNNPSQPPLVNWRLRHQSPIEPGEVVRIDFSTIPGNLSGLERKKAREVLRNATVDAANQGKEVAIPAAGFQDVMEDSRIASTSWQGVNAPADERQVIRQLVQGGYKLPRIHPIPYTGKRLLVADGNGLVLIFRSQVTEHMLKGILPLVNEAAMRFMEEVKAPSEESMKENLRGPHFFCIAGHDRNNKEKPALSKWHLANEEVLARFFAEGQPLQVLTRYGCKIVRRIFPEIVKRFEDCAQKIGIKPLYGGMFFNFCLNGARMDGSRPIPRVFCEPHIDFKNLALAVCMVFVYGHFNHREKCWIVIWEAGVALEIPMGVFILYPSSLFLHFNVDITNLNFVVTNGDQPTKENSTPLNCLCGDPEADHGESWRNAQGRGSMVWFNQASMFQTTELGFNTVAQARAAGAETTCDAEKWLEKGIFPYVSLDD
ncbi:hypothetical protein V5O48_003781 [Marasmius crinis-equi]|uniref:Uncharacterized protein n=1 Tax=Marasmius crinis-equi TaxID=585013 RepID=A0ABR3FRY9_9AGAR